MRFFSLAVVTLILTLIAAPCSAQKARVELELMMARGFPPQNAHEWSRALQDVGADGIRIRTAKVGDDIGIKSVGSERLPAYKVYGFLNSNDELVLDGAKFKRSQIGGIKTYIERLRAEGIDGLLTEKLAFGLSADELVALHEDLGKSLTFDTKSKEVGDMLRQLGNRIRTPIKVDPAAARQFDEDFKVLEEMMGMSAGTALAAMVRPLGCVVVPTKSGREVSLVIKRTQDADEHWPIGWPLEKAPHLVAPKLFESVPVDISNGVVLKNALDFVEERVEIPFIYDQNFMAKHGIEMSKVEVNLQGKMSYSRVVKRLLSQTRPTMQPELRKDEQGKPFFWISSVVQ